MANLDLTMPDHPVSAEVYELLVALSNIPLDDLRKLHRFVMLLSRGVISNTEFITACNMASSAYVDPSDALTFLDDLACHYERIAENPNTRKAGIYQTQRGKGV